MFNSYLWKECLNSCPIHYMHPTGSYPNAEEMANVTACASSYNGECCKYSHDMQVKNCTDFLVYKLQPVVHCNQAYCFGKFSVYLFICLWSKQYTLVPQGLAVIFSHHQVYIKHIPGDVKI
jgi:hypothetical protein